MKKIISIFIIFFLWNNFSFAKNLPTLECIIENPGGSKTTQVYDLQEIEKLDPTNNFKGNNEFEAFSKRDGEWTSLHIFDDVYRLRYSTIVNGLEAAHHITINRKTGVFESFILRKHSVHTSFADLLKLIADAPRYNGICERKANKKL
jgi:hypothetical protein